MKLTKSTAPDQVIKKGLILLDSGRLKRFARMLTMMSPASFNHPHPAANGMSCCMFRLHLTVRAKY